jgi:hypothetical protein
MRLSDFKRSLVHHRPPPSLAPALAALWWSAKDDWEKAHAIVMDCDDAECAWVHAYLHRREGDIANAGYWYRQARRLPATMALAAEWKAIATALLENA